jgi:hypothetical protein
MISTMLNSTHKPLGNLMARQQPEARLVNRIKTQLEMKYGGLWIKIHGSAYQQSGIPDLVSCFHGYFVAFEVKVPERKGTVTKLQQRTLELIEENGGAAAVVTSPEEALEYIRGWFYDTEPQEM